MTEQEQQPPLEDEYVQIACREIAETTQQFAGADGPSLAGAFAGVVVALVKEIFERLAVVERALSIVDDSGPSRQVALPAKEVVTPPDGAAPSSQIGLQLVPQPPPVAPIQDPRLEQIRQMEEMLRLMRGGASIPSIPASARVVRYEVRHTDGSLAAHVPDSVRIQPTKESAEHAMAGILATHPGWRDKLFVQELP